MASSSRIPVALLSCGSFNPPTYAHLRMFERARDYLEKTLHYKVYDGILSPVNDAYGKKELVSARHRVKMVQLAVESSDWITCDTWESSQGQWCRTVLVLRHIREMLRQKYCQKSNLHNLTAIDNNNGINNPPSSSSKKRRSDSESNLKIVPKLMLLCGADLLESWAVPNLWQKEDMEEIVRDYGLVVIPRNDYDPYKFIFENDVTSKFENNIHIVREWHADDISSTKIRRALQRNDSVRYLTPDKVLQYIKENKLYSQPVVPQTSDTNANNDNVASISQMAGPFEDSDYDNVPRSKLDDVRTETAHQNSYYKHYSSNYNNHTSSTTSDSRTCLENTAPPSSVTLASPSHHDRVEPFEVPANRRASLTDKYKNHQSLPSILRKPRPVSYHQELNRELTNDVKRENGYVKSHNHSMTNLSNVNAATPTVPKQQQQQQPQRFEEVAWEYDPERTKSLPNLKLKWSPKFRFMQNQKIPSVANVVVKVKQLRLTITPETTV